MRALTFVLVAIVLASPARAVDPQPSSSSSTACSNGLDDDEDGRTDFPSDPGCASGEDDDEGDLSTECTNAVDDDNDGATDFPLDQSCVSPFDTTESPECGDGIDNDGDGLADLLDSDCTGPGDESEWPRYACGDLSDNDGDGLVDFPDDPGCTSVNDRDENDAMGGATPVPRMLVLVGTSGSMRDDICGGPTGGDGSYECSGVDVDCATCQSLTCGNLIADDSKLDRVRQGVRGALTSSFGAEVSLARFSQWATPFTCPTEADDSPSGGWQGSGASTCEGLEGADLLTRFSEDYSLLLEWLDGSAGYTAPPGAPPLGFDIELRPTGTRPIGAALADAREWLMEARQNDLHGDCRPYAIVLIVDGAESCGGDPAAEAAALRAEGIELYVVGMAVRSEAEWGALDAIAQQAGTTGTAMSASETTQLQDILRTIEEGLTPEGGVCQQDAGISVADAGADDAGASDAGSDDAGAADAGAFVDAGPLVDGGTFDDAGPLVDGGSPVDPDAGQVVDAGIFEDGGSPVGADAGLDAGPLTDDDGGLSIDAGGVGDAGATPDAGSLADAGHADDAGVVADAGPTEDAGSLPDDDAGTLADAGDDRHRDGSIVDDEPPATGCGCSGAGGASGGEALGVLAALLAMRRRRRSANTAT